MIRLNMSGLTGGSGLRVLTRVAPNKHFTTRHTCMTVYVTKDFDEHDVHTRREISDSEHRPVVTEVNKKP